MVKKKTVKRGRPPKRREPVETKTKSRPVTKKQDIEGDDFFKRPGEVKVKQPSQKIAKEINEIKKILDQEKAVLDRIKAAKESAVKYMIEGYAVPGYKAVDALGHAKWKDGITAAKVYTEFKKFISKKADVLTEPVLKSPAQVKNYFIEDESAMKKFQSMTQRPDNGKKIAKV